MIAPQASVYASDVHIGTVDFKFWDAGMAVAGGTFLPTRQYLPCRHATELEGMDRQLSEESTTLRIVLVGGVPLACERIALIDWAETAGEEHGREVVAFGVEQFAI